MFSAGFNAPAVWMDLKLIQLIHQFAKVVLCKITKRRGVCRVRSYRLFILFSNTVLWSFITKGPAGGIINFKMQSNIDFDFYRLNV